MTTINTNSTASTSSGSSVSSALSSTMSQADFLKLMTAQLQAQDPTNPVNNSQFVSQMAQFSQLSATQKLDTDLTTLSNNVSSATQTNQMLSSSNLLDRSVLVPSSNLAYSGSAMNGGVQVTSAGPVTVQIADSAGNVVRTIQLGTQNAGMSNFSWDGKDDNGNALPSGNYTVSASSGSTALNTYVAGTVTSVGYGGTTAGTTLQVAGVGDVSLSQVAQIL
ncbi:flagellar hook assembly protein FlgD [Dyella sp. A6]|uniref:flagellar hook assembly protein FlgD n=1 Tax=Dyella aluminiiresistens TaxID=3069105 RepID=UPI002E79AE88|nr:FlgD immunoglobulin-like domain containing protein [Dyella sp. A6]